MTKLSAKAVLAVSSSVEPRPQIAVDDQQSPRPPEYSDDAIALQFAEKHQHDRRYVASWSQWLTWNGVHWRRDDTLKIFDDARAICRKASSVCNDHRLAKLLASAPSVSATERLARADRKLAARADQFDADRRILGTPGGLVDLRNGKIRSAQPEDYVSKITAISPGGRCDRWMKFLDEITNGDTDLQAYLSRVAGYALTGDISEQTLFFLFGLQANGKTTFIETIAGMLGDYAVPAPIEMFAASKFTGHTTDVAGLQGARLVVASETEAGRTLAEARIKLLTGGDMISARKMRSDNIAFRPQFKLVLLGNHKPRIASSDRAIRRRIQLVPFNVTFGPERRDRDLAERLRAEWPGILQWAIDGCLQWQRIGLRPPAAVSDATAEYLDAEDTIAHWIATAIERDSASVSATSDLYGSWLDFAKSTNEPPGSQKDLVDALKQHGFELKKTRENNRWIGLRLKGKG